MKIETSEMPAGLPLSAALTQSSCTTAQAARILGISVGTVQKLVERSELQAWRTPGGHRRVLLNSLHQYQQSHQIPVQGVSPSKNPTGLRLVLVDDCEPHAQVFRELQDLLQGHAQCTQVASGVAALMGLIQAIPDVLIVNAAMKDMDVSTFLLALREDPRLVGMVCVVLCPDPNAQPNRDNWPDSVAVVAGPLRLDWLQGLISGLRLLRTRNLPYRS